MVAQKNKRVGNTSYRHFFGESYDKIRYWALQITQNDTEFCDRVIQETFNKLSKDNDNSSGLNPDACLYFALRNAYLSQTRKNGSGTVMSLLDIDLVTDSFLLPNLDNQSNLISQLWAICEYSCIRKENSIAGSIIILSFFYGYNLSEIELITKRSRKALTGRIFSAKRELSRFFEYPQKYSNQEKNKDLKPVNDEKPILIESGLIQRFKERVYENRKGKCFGLAYLREIYFQEKPTDCKLLSHVVSCPKCLQKVTKILKLSSRKETQFFGILGKIPEFSKSEGILETTFPISSV